MTEPYRPPDVRQLVLATAIAFLAASVVLVTAILPAEYGIDPTGLGGVMGLTALSGSDELENAAPVVPPLSLSEFTGSWPTSTTALFDGEVYVGAEGHSLVVPVSDPNLVSFEVRVTWTDDNETAGQTTAPDTVGLLVAPPKGAASEVSAEEGVLEAVRLWSEAPDSETVTSASADDAFNALRDLHPPDHTGSGDWVLNLTIDPGQIEVQGTEIPDTDDGNRVRIEVSSTHYELDTDFAATATRVVERSFFLEPGNGLEFKVFLETDESIEYAWNVTAGEVYYDFHGDPAGGDGSDFVRHKESTAASDSGTFKAPFDGRHGWYWQNVHSTPLTVSVTVRGSFVMLE